MLKKAPVTKMYNINIYCDKCGKQMSRSGHRIDMNDEKIFYKYQCECGWSCESDQNYPCQQIILDMNQLEDV